MMEKLSRRGFLAGLGRWSFLAVLTGLMGRSTVQAFRGKEAGRLPASLAVCDDCRLLPACQLPTGIEARAALNLALAEASRVRAGERGACGSISRPTPPSTV